MTIYILRRLALIPLTLLGILFINFVIIQLAPGGPVEQILAKYDDVNTASTAQFSGVGAKEAGSSSSYRASQGMDPDLIKELEKQFGFDQPLLTRFWMMVKNYAVFDFGTSFYQDRSVLDLILDKLPVSISLGVWSTFLIYLISIPLGIKKAVKDGSSFDISTSWMIVIGYAIPSFLFAIFLIVIFAGGSYLHWFPLQGLISDNWMDLSWGMKIVDYFHHLALPVLALTIGGFAALTMLTKNSFLEEMHKQYVITAKAKGCSEKQVLYGHNF